MSLRNTEIVRPCGSMYQIISHPVHHQSKAIELAAFNEHRFAFFFWNKWVKNLRKKNPDTKAPALVTLDWHQDLVYPSAIEKEWLRALDLKNNETVSLYSWTRLNHLNDSHIMSAAYLNLIGNVYVNCRQGRFEANWLDEKIEDINGNIHTIRKFRTFEELEKALLASSEHSVFFDIDLDYFAIKNGLSDGSFKFTYLPDNEIKNLLSPQRPLIKWIFDRMEGFTVALEPEHTGGLLRSNRYFALIDKIYFKPGLFSHHSNWKHVSDYRRKKTRL